MRPVKYADPYPLISTKTPIPSYNSRTMKSVSNKQLIVNKQIEYKPLEVQIVHKRPKYVSNYNVISGISGYNDRNLLYLENYQLESNNIPNLQKPVIDLAAAIKEEPKTEKVKEKVEVLTNGEIIPIGEVDMTGEGFGDFIKGIKETASKIKDTAKAIFKGQSRLQPPERKLMEQYGDKVITKLVIQRAPIKTVPVDSLMNLITNGNFNKSLQEYGYDKLFHLFVIITLEDQTEISLEKNETIQMKKSPQKSNYESLNVSLSGKVITLNELMEKTSNLMGSNFFPYHPINNNCQTFISSVMKAIGLNTSQIDTFVNQPVDKLFETYDKTGKLTNWMAKITQLGTKMNFLKRGGKIHYKMHS